MPDIVLVNQYSNILLTAGLVIFAWLQWRVVKAQHNTSLFKLRVEHIAVLLKKWQEIESMVYHIPRYESKIIAKNGNQNEIVDNFNEIIKQLTIHNIGTKALFNDNLSKEEKGFISSLHSIIPSPGLDWTSYVVTETFEQLVKDFENLYKHYTDVI
jgi:hypothetical protein